MKKNQYHPLRWAIWSLAAAFYFFEFFIRVAPGVMIPDLMSAFNVDAASIGSLTAFYFYIYAPMQLLVGVLTDKYGARRLLALAALGAGLGTLLFGLATQFWMAALGRILMGAGSSFGFIGMIYVCSHWFSIKRRGILIGIANGIGMLGAVFGEGPLRILINSIGWRLSMICLAVVGGLLALLIYLVVRNEPSGYKGSKEPQEPVWFNLKTVIKSLHSWINAISSGLAYLISPAFASLWGIPFLTSNYGISTAEAGFAVSMIFIGWAIGGPVVGRISDIMRVKKPVLVICYLLAGILLGLVVFIPHIPLALLYVLFFVIGFFVSAQLLNYGYSIDINPKEAKGTAAAFTNFVAIALSAVSQPFLGYLLDLQWKGNMTGNVRIYSAEAYKWTVATIPLCLLLAFFLSLFLKKVKISRV